MNHVMIDLETLAVTPRAKVIEVACAVFDPWTGEVGAQFVEEIGPHAGANLGREEDEETKAWWALRILDGHRCPGDHREASVLEEAAWRFSCWASDFGMGKETRVWSWGIDFDCTIWRSVLAECGHEEWWRYNLQRDARTLCAAAGVAKVRNAHRALPDVLEEIEAVERAVRILGIKPNGRF
jgi:hypothetical protein